MAGKRKAPTAPLFDQIVFAPDREHVPGARRVVSFDEEDEPDYLKAIDEAAVDKRPLLRRGHDHGAWAELDLSASGVDPLRQTVDLEGWRARWDLSRPILLRGILEEIPESEVQRGLEIGELLATATGLKELLSQGFETSDASPRVIEGATSEDPRVLEKLHFETTEGQALWMASGRLSDHEEDHSLRLRISFGHEVEQDISQDEEAHLAVTRVAEACLPGALRVDLNPELGERLTQLVGEDPYLTQHIAYWNAPQGGALMHHDAFDAPDNGGQRGVVYTQLSGATAWLALSIEDLADRITDYCEFLEEGGADWVRKHLWPERRDFDRVMARTHDRRAFLRELALPGCGIFAGLVNQGPDFTSFLADAGHAIFVRAGDSLLMPSHGLSNCLMHSVFCASDEPTYAISAALRTRSASVPGGTE